MTDGNRDVVLMFPKDRCEDYCFNGISCVKIDTGMSVEELILMLTKWEVSGEPYGSAVRKEEENN